MATDELQETIASSVAVGEELAGLQVRRGERVGRYVLTEKLGAGGMGEVWAAHDPELDRIVAIKLVKPKGSPDDEPAHHRMLREAQALARLSHPNVVAVYDAGTHGDRIFIAMEYVEGRTLSAWLRDGARPWREVLPLMLAAGEGLLAAHEHGIVHRDFKPANVMVDDAGKARVLDFGLALSSDAPRDPKLLSSTSQRAPPSDASSERLALSGRLTRTGIVMGTPAFMAPEQFSEEEVDARADQFSFCVVLYRALYGCKPFSGSTYADLRRAVQHGEVRQPPREVSVPAGIRRVVMRGLSVWPRDRYPSMRELLAALRRAAGSPRRMRMLAAGMIAVTAVGAGAFFLAHRLAPAPCQGAEDRVAQVWSASQQSGVAAAFRATSLPYADDALASVRASTDVYAQDWVAMYEEACAATRVHGDQSEDLLDRRMLCLDERLHSLGAWAELLMAADADVVRNAATGAADLPAIRDCGDRAALAEPLPPPPAAVGSEVEAIRRELATVRALGLGGRFSRASTQAETLIERARTVDYPPLLAEVALVGGFVADRNGQAPLARADYEEALFAAELARHDRVRAEALMGLTNVLGYRLHEHDAAIRHARHAEAVLGRLGDPPELRARLELYLGNTEFAAGNVAPANAHFVTAIDLVRDVPSAWLLQIGALSNLAATQAMLGDFVQAVAALESARVLAVERLGELHPTVAVQDTNLAGMYSRLERHDEALAAVERSLSSYRAEHGPVHPDIGRALNVLGTVLSARGDDEAALEAYRESLVIKEQATGVDPSLATSVNNLGNVLLRLRRPEEAAEAFRRAASIWTDTLGAEHENVGLALSGLAEALLDAHDVAGAADAIARAEALLADSDVEGVLRARSRFAHARIVLAQEGDRARGIELAEEALQLYETTDAPASQEIATLMQWLERHRR